MEVLWLFICGCLSVGFYIYYHSKLTPLQNLLFKTVSSLMFLAVGMVAMIKNPDGKTYAQWIIMGLACGFLGDVVLAGKEIYPIDRHRFVIGGLLLFLIGHVLYLVALVKQLVYPVYLYVAIILLITMVMIVVNQLKVKLAFGKTKWAVFLYTLAINTLLIVAILNLFGDWSGYKILIALGALFFVVSDYVLSLLYFSKLSSLYRRRLKTLNLLLYYGGQFLLALSILWA
ncbi:MAG: lysoplasmalogenase [Bacilli bacterium]